MFLDNTIANKDRKKEQAKIVVKEAGQEVKP
jgi:hypothetical protein